MRKEWSNCLWCCQFSFYKTHSYQSQILIIKITGVKEVTWGYQHHELCNAAAVNCGTQRWVLFSKATGERQGTTTSCHVRERKFTVLRWRTTNSLVFCGQLRAANRLFCCFTADDMSCNLKAYKGILIRRQELVGHMGSEDWADPLTVSSTLYIYFLPALLFSHTCTHTHTLSFVTEGDLDR